MSLRIISASDPKPPFTPGDIGVRIGYVGGRHDRLLLPKTIAEKFTYGETSGRALPLRGFITVTPVATKEALKLFQLFVALFFSKTDSVNKERWP
jgi:hypothetical protein